MTTADSNFNALWLEGGGPAFPVATGGSSNTLTYKGMSLRDWFAGQALVGLALNRQAYDFSPESMTQWAFTVADAMLEARKPKAESV